MKQINKDRLIGSGLFIWIIVIALVVISGKLPATSIIKKSVQDTISHNEEYVILSTEGPAEILSAQLFISVGGRYVIVTYKELSGTVYTEVHLLKRLNKKIDGFKIRYVEQENLDEQ